MIRYEGDLYKDGKLVDAITKKTREEVEHYFRHEPKGSYIITKKQTDY